MQAYAIVWGPAQKGVVLRLRSGNEVLAIFSEYKDVVKTLAGLTDIDNHKIIEVEISSAS